MTIEEQMIENNLKSYKITKDDLGRIINNSLKAVIAVDVGRTLKFSNGQLVMAKRATFNSFKTKTMKSMMSKKNG